LFKDWLNNGWVNLVLLNEILGPVPNGYNPNKKAYALFKVLYHVSEFTKSWVSS